MIQRLGFFKGGNETRLFACQEKEVLCNKEADAISPCCERAWVSCIWHGSGSQTLLRVITDIYVVTLVKKCCWGSEYDASCRQVYIDQCFMLVCLDVSLHMHHQIRVNVTHRYTRVVIPWVCVKGGPDPLTLPSPHCHSSIMHVHCFFPFLQSTTTSTSRQHSSRAQLQPGCHAPGFISTAYTG